MTGYNGPGNNQVVDSWGGSTMIWHHMLAQKGFLVVCVDTRGTMNRGRDFKHSTYLQLGKYETEDMISAAKYIGGLPYTDGDNIGIYSTQVRQAHYSVFQQRGTRCISHNHIEYVQPPGTYATKLNHNNNNMEVAVGQPKFLPCWVNYAIGVSVWWYNRGHHPSV